MSRVALNGNLAGDHENLRRVWSLENIEGASVDAISAMTWSVGGVSPILVGGVCTVFASIS